MSYQIRYKLTIDSDEQVTICPCNTQKSKFCPTCEQKLAYCPELMHRPGRRAIFACHNRACENFDAEKNTYFVLGNLDNFGNGVERLTKESKSWLPTTSNDATNSPRGYFARCCQIQHYSGDGMKKDEFVQEVMKKAEDWVDLNTVEQAEAEKSYDQGSTVNEAVFDLIEGHSGFTGHGPA